MVHVKQEPGESDQKVPCSVLVNMLNTPARNNQIPTTVLKSEPPIAPERSPSMLPDIDCLFSTIRNHSEPKRYTQVEEVTSEEYTPISTDETQLLDLDHPMNTELTFYDENQPIKQEPYCDTYQPCSQYGTLSPQQNYREDQFDKVESMLFEDINRDIQLACSVLDIPQDPVSWTTEHVQKWVIWALDRNKLPLYITDQFQIPGVNLCAMSEQDFCTRSPQAGNTLYAQLIIWRNAFSNDLNQSYSSFSDSSQFSYGVQTSSPDPFLGANIPAPIPSVSPAPSETSMDSGHGSFTSNGSYEESFNFTEASKTETIMDHKPPHPGRQTIHLWQFLKELLLEPRSYSNCIRWLDRGRGIFKIEDSVRVAKLWGKRKNRPAMNYDKLSRSIRQYYKKQIIKKTEHSKRLVYQFCQPYL